MPGKSQRSFASLRMTRKGDGAVWRCARCDGSAMVLFEGPNGVGSHWTSGGGGEVGFGVDVAEEGALFFGQGIGNDEVQVQGVTDETLKGVVFFPQVPA